MTRINPDNPFKRILPPGVQPAPEEEELGDKFMVSGDDIVMLELGPRDNEGTEE